jgi:hypothetical protein
MRFYIYLTALLWLLEPDATFCQAQISGRVQDDSGKPLAAASVFLAGTSFGTVANSEGQFSLSGMMAGRYDLVVSCIGYQTFTRSVDTRSLEGGLNITLKVKTEELDNVIVEPGIESTWKEWGKFFLDNFIGTMPEARQCVIENSAAIRFRHYRKQKLLSATSKKPLIISNKTLGYTLTYQLEHFQFDFESRIVYFLGYPLFKEMQPKNERQKKQWEQNRKETYLGSQMHFMRSLYRNTMLEEGFEIRKLVKQPNNEKERVKNLMVKKAQASGALSISISGNDGPVIASGNSDSSTYYREIMNQPNEIDILYSPLIPGDSIAFQLDPHTAGLYFEDYLHVTYTGEREHPDYLRAQMRGTEKPGFQISTLKMNEPRNLEINQQGMVHDPLLILLSGYWAWSDKIATMLPFDYKLP